MISTELLMYLTAPFGGVLAESDSIRRSTVSAVLEGCWSDAARIDEQPPDTTVDLDA